MLTRRMFLGTVGAGLVLGPPAFAAETAPSKRKRLAVVTTEWRFHSHAWHMAERFLVGYPINGRWHRPPLDVVAAYVDQKPEGDLSRKRSEEFGFPIYPTIAETLRCGGDKLAAPPESVATSFMLRINLLRFLGSSGALACNQVLGLQPANGTIK